MTDLEITVAISHAEHVLRTVTKLRDALSKVNGRENAPWIRKLNAAVYYQKEIVKHIKAVHNVR